MSAAASSLATPLKRWGGIGVVAVGGWLGTDLLLHVGHGISHGLLDLGLTGAGLLWLQGRLGRTRPALAPTSVQGWLGRCDRLLEQFKALEDEAAPEPVAAQQHRREQLQLLRTSLANPSVQLAVAGTILPPASCQPQLMEPLRSSQGLCLRWGEPLPRGSADWVWPLGLADSDLLLYCLHLPLSAADLRWLEARPNGQPAWVLAQLPEAGEVPAAWIAELQQQLPQLPPDNLLAWNGDAADLPRALAPLGDSLRQQGGDLRRSARLRRVQDLHQQWLLQLEQRRRQQWRQLQQKTQWIVAAGVMAAPGAGLDLLVLTIANGLMLQQMARLWDCPWTLEQLRAAASELAQAALGLGVIEWSNQALATLLRLHGAGWLVGGAVQALSAAYLTRVVGHAMADMLALSSGLSEPNLAAIKAQAPALVQQAAEAEKLDWPAFVDQARSWLKQQSSGTAGLTLAPQT